MQSWWYQIQTKGDPCAVLHEVWCYFDLVILLYPCTAVCKQLVGRRLWHESPKYENVGRVFRALSLHWFDALSVVAIPQLSLSATLSKPVLDSGTCYYYYNEATVAIFPQPSKLVLMFQHFYIAVDTYWSCQARNGGVQHGRSTT